VDDLALLQAWRSGDQAAGRQLFSRHFDAMKRFFRNKVSSDIEDLIQQTFMVCVETQERVRPDASFRAYLYGIAHNVLRNALRTKRRKEGPIDFGVTSMHALDPTPSQYVAKRQEQQIILLGLRRIPLDYQVALELYYWEQMDRNEIAEALGIPPGTAATRLRRGRQLLQEQLEELAETPSALEKTITGLETWAAQLRDGVQSR
jgi:RNA polymerase sigma-70 factor (ECF subfamily)